MDHATAESSKVDGYASALLEIARVEDSGDDLANEMYAAANALAGNAELIEVLRDPAVPTERKQGIVNDLLGTRASRTTVASMSFLIASGQARHLGDIARRLADMAAAAEGEVVAEVRSPLPLAADQVTRLEEALSRATNKRVQVKVIVDPSVVGGLVTKVGDTVLDGSIRGRFEELREQWG